MQARSPFTGRPPGHVRSRDWTAPRLPIESPTFAGYNRGSIAQTSAMHILEPPSPILSAGQGAIRVVVAQESEIEALLLQVSVSLRHGARSQAQGPPGGWCISGTPQGRPRLGEPHARPPQVQVNNERFKMAVDVLGPAASDACWFIFL